MLRTYPARRPGYPFAPNGERSVARGISKVVRRARHLIYLEDQYLWSREVAAGFALKRAAGPRSHLCPVAVIPAHPDQEGRISTATNLVGPSRSAFPEMLRRAGGDRVAIYSLENHESTPVYVHAKVCIVDDMWYCVGSDNINRRSWTHDSELSCAVVEEDTGASDSGKRLHALELRLMLAREHLDRVDGDDGDLVDAKSAFGAFAAGAADLDRWHGAGRLGERPAGRLRTYPTPELTRWARGWAAPVYRALFDPDGRSRTMQCGTKCTVTVTQRRCHHAGAADFPRELVRVSLSPTEQSPCR